VKEIKQKLCEFQRNRLFEYTVLMTGSMRGNMKVMFCLVGLFVLSSFRFIF